MQTKTLWLYMDIGWIAAIDDIVHDCEKTSISAEV